ncbi:unnamed protein product [Diatraea saccharalis]|uniref:Enoyl reductase (ER) domain-containing protein n=1 Tax=Diatraea saccharalis TaxID=40085 RepID=A0A9N9WH70_9NEOP|nr:unnamed protein product [Diatraea saccharalis]
MDELKNRAGEKLEALQLAAKTAADGGKNRVQDVFSQAAESIRKLHEAFQELWQNELFAESRQRVVAWTREATQRIREGALPLSPVLLYEELVALFKDRVWRRSVIIFVCGAALGGGAGLCVGLRAGARAPSGPHARALHSQPDQSVILVEDAVAPGAGAGEVLVRVQAFSVCPVDRGVLRGRGSTLRSLITRTQLTVGRGFAGVVLDVGPGVDCLELGDEVWGCISEWAGGAAGELLTVRSTRVSKRPRSVAADGAATLPWAASGALAALEYLNLTPETAKGKRVAICGAASGEGCVLVQLLSSWGAHLTVLAPRQAAMVLQDLGAQEFVDSVESGSCWRALEQAGARAGPWHCALACPGAHAGPCTNQSAILKATAAKNAIVDLRPQPFISDRLPTPLTFVYAVSFYTFRALRWLVGMGSHTDWLEDPHRLRPGLEYIAELVDTGRLQPVLDKVFMPQDFESALAHACNEDAIGTTVIRFP